MYSRMLFLGRGPEPRGGVHFSGLWGLKLPKSVLPHALGEGARSHARYTIWEFGGLETCEKCTHSWGRGPREGLQSVLPRASGEGPAATWRSTQFERGMWHSSTRIFALLRRVEARQTTFGRGSAHFESWYFFFWWAWFKNRLHFVVRACPPQKDLLFRSAATGFSTSAGLCSTR